MGTYYHCSFVQDVSEIMRSYRLLLLCVVGLLSISCRAFENPIKTVDGSDPFMVYQEGYYYLLSMFLYVLST